MNIISCRTDKQCGLQKTCVGNLFGLKLGHCKSTKGLCRLDKQCPRYYQCVGNHSGLSTGKCLLALSKSNPLSKAVGNVSTSALDPASVYRKRHSMNLVLMLIATLILIGIVYFVVQFFKGPQPSPPGSCLTSYDCKGEAEYLAGGQAPINYVFQCGKLVWETRSPEQKKLCTTATPQDRTAPGCLPARKNADTIPNVCDCNILQGGGYSSQKIWFTKPWTKSDVSDPPKAEVDTINCCSSVTDILGKRCPVAKSSANCRVCENGRAIEYVFSPPPPDAPS